MSKRNSHAAKAVAVSNARSPGPSRPLPTNPRWHCPAGRTVTPAYGSNYDHQPVAVPRPPRYARQVTKSGWIARLSWPSQAEAGIVAEGCVICPISMSLGGPIRSSDRVPR